MTGPRDNSEALGWEIENLADTLLQDVETRPEGDWEATGIFAWDVALERQRQHEAWHYAMLSRPPAFLRAVERGDVWQCTQALRYSRASGDVPQVLRCGRCKGCDGYFARCCPVCQIPTHVLQSIPRRERERRMRTGA